MTEEFEANHDEEYCRDIIMEFVQMDGQPTEQRASVRSPFKKYTNKLKKKVIKDHIMTNRNSKDAMSKSLIGNQRLLPDRPRKGLKPVSVSRTRSRMISNPSKYSKSRQNLKYRSLSSDNIAHREVNNLSEGNDREVVQPFSIRRSVERLPTLSKFDEERIVWLKNLEDDIQFTDERRRRTVLSRQQAELVESSPSTTSSSDPPSSDPSTCVSIDNSPNIARKGGGGISAMGQSDALENIRKDEIKINNISNFINSSSTNLCKHPNQSQLHSMDHELSGKQPGKTEISLREVECANQGITNEQDEMTQDNMEDDEESLADDITYNIVEKKAYNEPMGDESKKVENTNNDSIEPCISNEANNIRSQNCTKLEDQNNISNNNEEIANEENRESMVNNDIIQNHDNSPKNKQDETPSDPLVNGESENITENDNEAVDVNQNTITTPRPNGNETMNDQDNIKETPTVEENVIGEKDVDALKIKARRKNKQHRPDLSAECFIVSRGWQMDQNKLLRALDRLKGVNFSRVQTATTINRVIESIRPHQDAVVIHICSQELMEAAQSIISVPNTLDMGYSKHSQTGNLAMGLSVVQSIATVLSRHIFTAAGQNRSTQFIISLPLPMTLIPLLPPNYEITETDVKNLCELRRSFNANLKSNLCKCPNVQCCDNENLASTMATAALLNSATLTAGLCKENEETQINSEKKIESSKLLNDNNQLTSAGMKKLARNWEIYLTMVSKGKEGQLILRRPSEESSGSINNDRNVDEANAGGSRKMSSSGESAGSDRSIDGRAPWKPY